MPISNEGNEGNVGNRGAGGAGVAMLPDRVDKPFVTEKGIANEKTAATWKDSHWDPYWGAWPLLTAFASKAWATEPSLKPAQYSIVAADVRQELRVLVKAAEQERADALGEIIAQHDGFLHYFANAFALSPTTHPLTCRLLHACSLIGALVSMHAKANAVGSNGTSAPRPRPSQILPALLPPVPVPRHPSYPSGHATQAHMMAACIRALVTPDGDNKPADVADSLAARIARNREIAGLHFESDSIAGKTLGVNAWTFATTGASSAIPTSVIAAAKAEWA